MNTGIIEILKREPRKVSNSITREVITIYPKEIVKFRAIKKL